MFFRIFSITLLVILLAGGAYGQQKVGENIPLRYSKSASWVNKFQPVDPAAVNRQSLLPEGINLRLSMPQSIVPADFYSSRLSFFCRTEWKLEKATSLSLRFRFGSLQYTDYLEQKPNARLH